MAAPKSSPRALMLADLARSGLDAEDAKRMGCEPWAPERTAREFPHAGAVPAYKIPYPGARCYRVRVLAPPPMPFGAEKPHYTRYWQPTKTAPAAYFPPLVDWQTVRETVEQSIILVEGEKKAARACKAGHPAIGLGGVFSFASKHHGWAMLPELRAVRWERRTVYVCYDSDAADNPQILLAIRRLDDVLTGLGAVVRVATMPRGAGSAKVGLDDFLEARGDAALDPHLAASPVGDLARKLWEMNGRYAALLNPPCVLDVLTADDGGPPPVYSAAQFTGLVVANEVCTETYLTAAGEERVREVALGKKWLEFPQRRQYQSLTYAPGHDRVLADGRLNSWRGLGVEPKRGDVKPWHRLLDHLFQGAPREARVWFERWCGYPLLHLGTKLQHAVGMWSVETGVGKSLVARTLGLVYGPNYLAIDQDDLESDFNQWALNKQFVLVDEVSAADTRKRADKFKKLLTQDKIWVNLKGVRQFSMPDHVNYMLTSNHANAFYIEDNDRRFFVHKVDVPALPRAFYDNYCHAWLGIPKPNGQAAVGGPRGPGAAALLHYFLHELDYGDFSPAERPPMTEAKADMMAGVRSPVDAWLAEAPALPLLAGRDLWTAEELCTAYNSSGGGRWAMAPNAFALHLGKRYKHVEADGRRLYVIRNASEWVQATRQAATAHHSAAQKL